MVKMIDHPTLPPPKLDRGVERPQNYVAEPAPYTNASQTQDNFWKQMTCAHIANRPIFQKNRTRKLLTKRKNPSIIHA